MKKMSELIYIYFFNNIFLNYFDKIITLQL